MLSARGLALRRGQGWLVRELDLTITAGQLWWLRGANGSGKTSLLRALVGVVRPEAGSVQYAQGSPCPVYIGHQPALKDDLSAHEALGFLAALHDRPREDGRIDSALQRLDVQHCGARAVRHLSQGQRRRVALARLALEHVPALWALDEPFDALDASGMAAVLALIGEHLQRHGSVILTSHVPLDIAGVTAYTLDLDKERAHG